MLRRSDARVRALHGGRGPVAFEGRAVTGGITGAKVLRVKVQGRAGSVGYPGSLNSPQIGR